MHETIVNPWVIYLIMESDTVCLTILLASLGGFALAFNMASKYSIRYKRALYDIKHNPGLADMASKKVYKYHLTYLCGYLLCAVFGVLAILALFCPSRDTLIALYVNQFITPDNVDKAIDIIKQIKNTYQ